jgi:predicted short-subunit dehydrogenase-like oxidoreductase (DUF2520 family)
MTTLLDEISALMVASDVDRERVERTLTDGYAHALHLEVERVRLQRRIDELTTALRRGDAGVKTRELSALSKLLDGNAADLMKLREILAELRRSAKR